MLKSLHLSRAEERVVDKIGKPRKAIPHPVLDPEVIRALKILLVTTVFIKRDERVHEEAREFFIRHIQ